MKILEQTNHILMLHQSSNNFWLGTIFSLFNSLFFMILSFLISYARWWGFILLLTATGLCIIALQQVWKSDVVKDCSFDKAFDRVTIRFHGLQTEIKDLPLQYIRAVQVRETIGFAYGAVIKNYDLWLVTKYGESIRLSEKYNKVLLEAIADQVREFLSLSNS